MPEDLAVTLLLNSRVDYRAFCSIEQNGSSLDLTLLPDTPLERTRDADRQHLAGQIAVVASWPGFGASTATKALHKKRPALIPVLDNQAIFGAYLKPDWPGKRSSMDTIKSRHTIREVIERIYVDLTRSANASAWPALHARSPGNTTIEVFDAVRWMRFRETEPVPTPAPRLAPETSTRLC